jgi:hypothetical protein
MNIIKIFILTSLALSVCAQAQVSSPINVKLPRVKRIFVHSATGTNMESMGLTGSDVESACRKATRESKQECLEAGYDDCIVILTRDKQLNLVENECKVKVKGFHIDDEIKWN